MNFLVFIFFLIYLFSNLIECRETDFCEHPWKKMSNEICLLLKSDTKTRDHANLICNYEGGNLLYVNNETEQRELENFLVPLLRYRFTFQPHIWLDAVQIGNKEWIWSKNGSPIAYSNWDKHAKKENKPPTDKCACFSLKSTFWNECDCASSQHFVCRKSSLKTSDSKRSQILNEATTLKPAFEDTNSANQNESETVIVVSQAENEPTNQMPPKRTISFKQAEQEDDNIDKKHEIDARLESNLISSGLLSMMRKESSNLIAHSGQYFNILRKKILKNSFTFNLFDCPRGFGYYIVKDNQDCSTFKLCQNWDDRFAIVTLNRCLDKKIFNLKTFKCVSSDELESIDENNNEYFNQIYKNCQSQKFAALN